MHKHVSISRSCCTCTTDDVDVWGDESSDWVDVKSSNKWSTTQNKKKWLYFHSQIPHLPPNFFSTKTTNFFPVQKRRKTQTQRPTQQNMSSSRDNDEENQYVYDLPRTCINRIVKRGLPEGVVLGNEPKTAFSKAAIVFIMYLTATYVYASLTKWCTSPHTRTHENNRLNHNPIITCINNTEPRNMHQSPEGPLSWPMMSLLRLMSWTCTDTRIVCWRPWMPIGRVKQRRMRRKRGRDRNSRYLVWTIVRRQLWHQQCQQQQRRRRHQLHPHPPPPPLLLLHPQHLPSNNYSCMVQWHMSSKNEHWRLTIYWDKINDSQLDYNDMITTFNICLIVWLPLRHGCDCEVWANKRNIYYRYCTIIHVCVHATAACCHKSNRERERDLLLRITPDSCHSCWNPTCNTSD